eukprot:15448_5
MRNLATLTSAAMSSWPKSSSTFLQTFPPSSLSMSLLTKSMPCMPNRRKHWRNGLLCFGPTWIFRSTRVLTFSPDESSPRNFEACRHTRWSSSESTHSKIPFLATRTRPCENAIGRSSCKLPTSPLITQRLSHSTISSPWSCTNLPLSSPKLPAA